MSLLQRIFNFADTPPKVLPTRASVAPRPKSKRIAPPVAGAHLTVIFQNAFRDLRPRSAVPDFDIRFRRFTTLNTTIRLREGRLHVRLSDLLEAAPESVHEAIAHILLAKLYRKPIERQYNDRYKRYVSSETVSKQAEQIRQQRGRKRILSAKGRYYDLDEVFDVLNRRYFHGLLGQPVLTWSEHHARRLLGHYDAAHNTIMISRVFDRAEVPRYAMEYLMYHEMLHLKHPVSVKNGRRCVHSREFQADEKLFPDFERAKVFLRRL